MEIIRHDDGSLTVPVVADRHAADGEPEGTVDLGPTTKVLRPGEGGYNEALAQWDLQQHPDHAEAVSTAEAIWGSINGPNLVENVLPTRSRASLVLSKGADHAVTRIRLRKL